jgi:hypothetical protein
MADNTDNTEYAINTRTSLILYIVVCSVMFIILLFGSVGITNTIVNYSQYTTSIKLLFLLFFASTFTVQLLMNMSISKKQKSCSSDNSYSGSNPVLITLMPWLFVLGIFMVILYYIPGLLRIFANTIGMAIVYDTFKVDINNQILAGREMIENQSSLSQDNLKAIYIKISTEPQLIINEMEYSDDVEFDDVYAKYLRAFPFIFINDEKFKNKIRQLIISKNIMGYAIWIALAGAIASLISTNAMINVEC